MGRAAYPFEQSNCYLRLGDAGVGTTRPAAGHSAPPHSRVCMGGSASTLLRVCKVRSPALGHAFAVKKGGNVDGGMGWAVAVTIP